MCISATFLASNSVLGPYFFVMEMINKPEFVLWHNECCEYENEIKVRISCQNYVASISSPNSLPQREKYKSNTF